jgi:hypothetical protein
MCAGCVRHVAVESVCNQCHVVHTLQKDTRSSGRYTGEAQAQCVSEYTDVLGTSDALASARALLGARRLSHRHTVLPATNPHHRRFGNCRHWTGRVLCVCASYG